MKYELYSKEYLERIKKNNRRWLAVILALAVSGFAACIFFCAATRTGNETTMELRTIVTSAVVGWIVIYLLDNVYIYRRRYCKHAELMLSEQGKEYCGTIEVRMKRQPVRGSVSVCTVILRDAAGEHLLRIESEQAKRLKAFTCALRVRTVYGYIVAFEEVAL